MITHLTGREPLIKQIVAKAFPEYKGRKISLKVEEKVHLHNLHWFEGSKNTYVCVQLIDSKIRGPLEIPAGNPYHGSDGKIIDLSILTGLLIVRHSYFCGKDMGIVIYCHPSMAVQSFLPAGDASILSEEEKKVLVATRSFKSSYAGDGNYRQSQSGLDLETYMAAKTSLIERKLLNKKGALTVAGRNVAETL